MFTTRGISSLSESNWAEELLADWIPSERIEFGNATGRYSTGGFERGATLKEARQRRPRQAASASTPLDCKAPVELDDPAPLAVGRLREKSHLQSQVRIPRPHR